LSDRVAASDAENVIRSLESVGTSLTVVVGMLADERRRIHVVPGAACRAVGVALVDLLSQLRDGVTLHYGPPTEVTRALAGAGNGDVVLIIDTRRYERWVIEVAAQARASGARVVAMTDTPLSPLVAGSDAQLLVRVVGAGPFDSLTGALSVVNALVAGVAALNHRSASTRLRRSEEALMRAGALVDVSPMSEEEQT
jgi:DNA-binding MurR/RpiR family transcriptional regulator